MKVLLVRWSSDFVITYSGWGCGTLEKSGSQVRKASTSDPPCGKEPEQSRFVGNIRKPLMQVSPPHHLPRKRRRPSLPVEQQGSPHPRFSKEGPRLKRKRETPCLLSPFLVHILCRKWVCCHPPRSDSCSSLATPSSGKEALLGGWMGTSLPPTCHKPQPAEFIGTTWRSKLRHNGKPASNFQS